jgi:hypothetical protein
MRRLLKASVLFALGTLVVRLLPDIKRYMRIRTM